MVLSCAQARQRKLSAISLFQSAVHVGGKEVRELPVVAGEVFDDGPAGAGQHALVLVNVELQGDAPGAQGGEALDVVGRFANFADDGDGDGGHDADDGNHRQ